MYVFNLYIYILIKKTSQMEETFEHVIGKFYPKMGHYYLCPVCGNNFFGRENKKYCGDPCRYKRNNTISKERRLETKEENKATRNNYLLLKQYYPASLGKTPINNSMLNNPSFDTKAPCKQLKHLETGVTMHFYHGYGFSHDTETKTIIIYKQDELH